MVEIKNKAFFYWRISNEANFFGFQFGLDQTKTFIGHGFNYIYGSLFRGIDLLFQKKHGKINKIGKAWIY